MSPLQLIIFRHSDDERAMLYEEAISNAFTGRKTPGAYILSVDDSGIQMNLFSDVPAKSGSVTDNLDNFCHTLTAVLVDHSLLTKGSSALWKWIVEAWHHTDESLGRHFMVFVMMDEAVADATKRQYPTIDSEFLYVQRLGEELIRPPTLALRLIYESSLLLSKKQHPRLFISHSKQDGLPLAHAIKHLIESTEWLECFYDINIRPGLSWKRELENAIETSLLIVLRTDGFDARSWCRQEVLWAEKYSTPGVLVDAHTRLQYPTSTLPFDRMPTVHIPDGNLFRILFLALREGLKSLYFLRRAQELFEKIKGSIKASLDREELIVLKVFPSHPTMPALLHVCQDFRNQRVLGVIVYPDPPFRAGLYEAALAIIEKHCPGTRLVTLNALATTSS